MSRSASGGADLLRFRSFTHYVAIEDSDLDNLPLPTSHTIEISEFVPLHQIQASLYFKSAYYVAPEKTGQKPYSDAPERGSPLRADRVRGPRERAPRRSVVGTRDHEE